MFCEIAERFSDISWAKAGGGKRVRASGLQWSTAMCNESGELCFLSESHPRDLTGTQGAGVKTALSRQSGAATNVTDAVDCHRFEPSSKAGTGSRT